MAPALTDQAGQIKLLPPPLKGGATTEDALEDLIPETLPSGDIMSQMDLNMGLKTNVDSVSKIQEKNEVDQLINNLTSNADVDDLMQAFKSIDNEHIDNFLDEMNISMEDQVYYQIFFFINFFFSTIITYYDDIILRNIY